ncbi:pentapeptide repeat-containing protein [Cellulomonas sp. URHB0016]
MARADDLRALRARWSGVDRAEIARLVSHLVRGVPIVDGPFGHVDDRVDLRGCPVTPTSTPAQRTTVGARAEGAADLPTWSGLDLSGAHLDAMSWMELSVRDCVLDDADLGGLRCWGVEVADTSLRRTSLSHGQLGTGLESYHLPSSWTDVDLRGADLRGAHAQVRFERVDFRNARFSATDWGWSDLVGCTFAGVVHGLTIGGRRAADRPPGWTLREVDLTSARPRDLVLNGVDLGAPEVDVRLPADDEHWRVEGWPAFLDRVASAVADLPDGDDRTVAAIWHEYEVGYLGARQQQGFIATCDVLRLGGPPLRELLRACLAPDA